MTVIGIMTNTSRKRPPAVTIIGGLFIFIAPFAALDGLLRLFELIAHDPSDPLAWLWRALIHFDWATLAELASVTYALVSSLLDLLIGIGLLQLRSRAWLWAMMLLGLSLMRNLYAYWLGDPDFFNMAIDAFFVLLLNQTEVQEAFY